MLQNVSAHSHFKAPGASAIGLGWVEEHGQVECDGCVAAIHLPSKVAGVGSDA
jgi:hypothetical protein